MFILQLNCKNSLGKKRIFIKYLTTLKRCLPLKCNFLFVKAHENLYLPVHQIPTVLFKRFLLFIFIFTVHVSFVWIFFLISYFTCSKIVGLLSRSATTSMKKMLGLCMPLSSGGPWMKLANTVSLGHWSSSTPVTPQVRGGTIMMPILKTFRSSMYKCIMYNKKTRLL